MSSNDVLSSYVSTATAAAGDDSETFSSSGILKRSRSLESFNSCSGDEEDHVTIPLLKKPRGRPRCTQPSTRKSRKQKKVAIKSAVIPSEPIAPQSHGKDAAPTSQVTDISSLTKSFPYQEQLDKAIDQCFVSHFSPSLQCLQQEVTQLREIIVNLSSRVTELTSLLSASGQIPVPNPCIQSEHQTFLPNAAIPQDTVSSHPLSYAAAASTVTRLAVVNRDNSARHLSRQSAHQTAQQSHNDAVTAMYVDQRRKQQRANNIVVTGFRHSDDDTKAVTDLLRSEFEWDAPNWPGINVTSCRRIGQRQENKVQPLIVTLSNNLQSDYYIKNAKLLRGSSDSVISSSVFINPDLTPSEAKAAYELRVQRRQRRLQWEQHLTECGGISTSRTFFRCIDKPLSSLAISSESSSTCNIIPPQPALDHTSTSSVPSRLVWSSRQTTTAVPVPVIPHTSCSSSVNNPNLLTSLPSLTPISPCALPVQDGVTISVSESSRIAAGSCP